MLEVGARTLGGLTMRTLEISRGMTLGTAGLTCAYTLLAVLVGSMNLFAGRLNQIVGHELFPTGFTPGLVTLAWLASLGLVLALPFTRRVEGSLPILWIVNGVAVVSWTFAALFPVMRIVFPPYPPLY